MKRKYLPDPTVHRQWREVTVLEDDGDVALVRSVNLDSGGRNRKDFRVLSSLLKDSIPKIRDRSYLRAEEERD